MIKRDRNQAQDPTRDATPFERPGPERSDPTGGGDPTGSAGGAGGKAPRGIDPDTGAAIGETISATGDVRVTPELAATIAAGASGVTPGMAPVAYDPDADPLIGQSVDRYRILDRLGAGGMGVVYRAHDPALDRKVALKLLPPRDEGMTQLEARLRREAQALARLDHPNVVAVYDVGVAAHSVFVAMQLVDGSTLGDWLAERKRAPAEVLALFAAAGRGLAAAHAAGIVHRDFKPANVLVDKAGGARVVDFGLARGEHDDSVDPAAVDPSAGTSLLDAELTRAGAVLGTPLYMAPEQHHGEAVTARSDQFSFCVSLWSALFGQHPFHAGAWDVAKVLDAMDHDRVREPPRVRGVPARVVAALRRGLRGAPAQRWPGMPALLAQLAPRRISPWLGVAAAALLAGGAVAVAMAGRAEEDPRASCRAAVGHMRAIWPAQGPALRTAIVAAGLPDPDATARLVTEGLDGYAGAWTTARLATCERDKVAATPALRDMQNRCLDLRRDVLADVLARMRAGGPGAIGLAVETVRSLPPVGDCAQHALEGMTPPTADQVAPLGALRRDLERAREQLKTIDEAESIKAMDALLVRAEAIGYAPVTAEVMAILAGLRAELGDSDPALATRAAELGMAARSDRIAGLAYVLLLRQASLADDQSRVETLLPIARAAASRSADPQVLARFAAVSGEAAVAMARYDEAIAGCEGALDAAPDVERKNLYACLIIANLKRGDAEAAGRWADHQLAHVTTRFGAGAYQLAQPLRAQAMVQRRLGNYDPALALYQRALAVIERIRGGDHPDSCDLLTDLAQMANEADKPDEGLAYADRAVRTCEASPRTRSFVASVHITQAQLLRKAGQREPMYVHYRTGIELFEARVHADDVNLAMARFSYGSALAEDEKIDEALAVIGQAAASLDRIGHPRAIMALVLRAEILQDHDRCPEALPLYEQAIAKLEAGKNDARNVLIARFNHAICVHEVGDDARARALAIAVRDEAATQGAGGAPIVEGVGDLLREIAKKGH